jgi:PEP-CTERM/exosortase A-associated glycosyltransferase
MRFYRQGEIEIRMGKSMKILHVLDHSIPIHSGYSYRTRSILKHQRLLGYKTDHITSIRHKDCECAEENINGYHFHRTNVTNRIIERMPVIRHAEVIRTMHRKLLSVIEQFSPDILHAHSPCLIGMAAVHAGKKHRIPVVYEMRAVWEDAAIDHGTVKPNDLRYKLSRALENYVLHRSDAVTTICHGLKKEIASRGVNSDKITVIPNAVDIDRFTVDRSKDKSLLRKYGLEGKIVVGYIGSFYHYEGLHILIKAVPKLLSLFKDLRFILVGDGKIRPALQRRARQLGVADAVIFTGAVPHEQVTAYYSLIDVCIYPRISLRLTELVTPLKPLEAMAKGKIVMASDIGGHRKLIEDGKTGFLFHAGDPESLVKRMTQLLQSLDNADMIANAGRRSVEQTKTWHHSVSKYIPVYESLLPESMLGSNIL